jgi:hypothetical protein
VNHYQALGVAADASDAEIRRAYLDLARRHHPDFHTSEGSGSVRAAEARMREINAAWAVLGTTSSRAAYDRALVVGDDPSLHTGSANPIRRPSSDFQPFYDADEDDDDSWRYEPDEGDPASAPPRSLLIAPPVALALGLALLLISLPTGLAPLTAVGIGCIVCSRAVVHRCPGGGALPQSDHRGAGAPAGLGSEPP